MARIRSVKFKQSNKKKQPKIAYLHSSNFDKAIKTNPVNKSKGTKVKIITLNDAQEKKYLQTIGSRKNKKVIKFHNSDYI